MAYNYIIDEKERIIHISLSGKCDNEELLELILDVTTNSDYRTDYNILSDYTECVLLGDLADLKEYNHLFEKIVSRGTGKIASIVDTPRETALTMLHQRTVRTTRDLRVFSTREAALSWFNSD